MKLTDETRQQLSELRKIEKQAKGLIYKMRRLEDAWNKIRNELGEKRRGIPTNLGDVLAKWNRISGSDS